jgi:aarF domain-containing kinase
MMEKNFGSDWKNKFIRFEEKPFASASIGQVHLATLPSR